MQQHSRRTSVGVSAWRISPHSTPDARRCRSSPRSGGSFTLCRTSHPSTLANYATLWDAHVLPRLGAMRLRDLNPEVIARFRADLTTKRRWASVRTQGSRDPPRRTPARGRVASDSGQPVPLGAQAVATPREGRSPAPARAGRADAGPPARPATPARRGPRLSPGVRRPPARRGARPRLGRHPRTDDPGRARCRAGSAEVNEDGPEKDCAPARPPRRRPERMAPRPGQAG